MDKRTKGAISLVEDVLRNFRFMEYDEIEIDGLDSIIALRFKENMKIQKCEIKTKVIESNPNIKTETYVLILWVGDEKNPLTFKSITTPVD